MNNNIHSLLQLIYSHDMQHLWIQESEDEYGLQNTKRKMKKQDYTYVFTTDITPVEALDAISRATEWRA